MKKTILILLSIIGLSTIFFVQNANAQDKTEPWPGVTIKVLTDNEHVKISEVTFAPGAVADWHSHPQHTIYAVTNSKTKEEIKGKEAATRELKAGQARWSPAVEHRTTNISDAAYTVILTEIKK